MLKDLHQSNQNGIPYLRCRIVMDIMVALHLGMPVECDVAAGGMTGHHMRFPLKGGMTLSPLSRSK